MRATDGCSFCERFDAVACNGTSVDAPPPEGGVRWVSASPRLNLPNWGSCLIALPENSMCPASEAQANRAIHPRDGQDIEFR